jgi:hypothetical protein
MDIRSLVDEFAARLSSLIEHQVLERARAVVDGALAGNRPNHALKRRKKAPRQLCPIPGCTNAAAPVFGMVCAKHKDVSKAKIKKYREARRAKKLKAAA